MDRNMTIPDAAAATEALEVIRDPQTPKGAPFPRMSDRALFAFSQGAVNLVQLAHGGCMTSAMTLMRGWLNVSQYSIVTDPTCAKVTLCWWPEGLSGERSLQAEAWADLGDEPRALLDCLLQVAAEQEATPAPEGV